MTPFEQFCQLRGMHWHQAAPITVRDWIRVALLNGWRIEQVAGELANISEAFNKIGASDPTTSDLVTAEMSKHWQIPAPMGWTEQEISTWRKLPYLAAKFVTEKRRADVKVIRNLQNADAAVKRELERLDTKGKPNHASHQAA